MAFGPQAAPWLIAGFVTTEQQLIHRSDPGPEKGRELPAVWLAQLVPGGPRLPVQGVVDVRFLGTATSYLTAVTP